MRSPLIPYETAEMAAAETAAGPESVTQTASPFYKSLDGTWKFKLIENPEADASAGLAGWTGTDFNSEKWEEIKVPGTWTLQGFNDHPHYTNVQMPFDTLPPNVPEHNPTGLYILETTVPSGWKGRRIVLHIGSAESVAEIHVNGELAGVSKDTRLPCEFDITRLIAGSDRKTVKIAIKVIRYSDASFVEDQDQWWFGGIHRSVYFYSTEKSYIQDVTALSYITPKTIGAKIKKLLTQAMSYEASIPEEPEQGSKPLSKCDGVIPLHISLGYDPEDGSALTNRKMDGLPRAVRYSVHQLAGTPSAGKLGKLVAEGIVFGEYNYRMNLNQIRTDIIIKNADLWSHENPALYVVTASLYEYEKNPGDKPELNRVAKVNSASLKKLGRHIESISFCTGFKSVEIKDREMLINRKMVYIHGVNRHEHSEYYGKTIPLENMVRDIKLLKQYNFNAVRTCHYPDDERWYDLCDRYGILLLDEANIENHAYYDNITRSDEWTNAYIQRVQRMVRRDKNHPSIFGWSLGNESGDGQNQVACQAWIRRVDPTRIVHYEGFIREAFTQAPFSLEGLARGKGLTDLISPMYPTIDLITEYVTKYSDYRPIIMCEYSHAMGNANGSLADYWRAIESHHGLQGGFIWDWIDQGIAADAPAGKPGEPQGGKYWKYGGDFGDTPSDYDFCLNGILLPDQTPKPVLEECRKVFSPVRIEGVHPQQGLFTVTNRYDFSVLENVALKWTVLKNGVSIKSGTAKLPKLEPDQSAKITLPLTGTVNSADNSEYYVNIEFIYKKDTACTKAGDVIGRSEFLLKPAMAMTAFVHEKNKVTDFNPDALSEIVAGFKPVLWRALTENECVKREIPNLHNNPQPWCFAEKPTTAWLDADLANAVVEQKKNGVAEIFTGPACSKKKKLATVRTQISECISPVNTKALRLDVEFNLTDALPEYPRAGIMVPVSALNGYASWYGNGPHENYSDRKDGALHGLYTVKADELEVPYIVPQENGTRTGTTYLCLHSAPQLDAKQENMPLHIQSMQPFSFNLSKYSLEDLWKCEHHNELTDFSAGQDGFYMLIIDAAHRGVGTGACGPDTLEQYRVRPGTYSLSLVIY